MEKQEQGGVVAQKNDDRGHKWVPGATNYGAPALRVLKACRAGVQIKTLWGSKVVRRSFDRTLPVPVKHSPGVLAPGSIRWRAFKNSFPPRGPLLFISFFLLFFDLLFGPEPIPYLVLFSFFGPFSFSLLQNGNQGSHWCPDLSRSEYDFRNQKSEIRSDGHGPEAM
jgi:hypothetical protein